MKKTLVVLLVVGGLALAGGITVLVLNTDHGPEAGDSAGRGKDEEEIKQRAANAGKHGERPAENRIREGHRQIETRSRALAEARASLERVEQELAAASDAQRPALERKKELIEQALARLTEPGAGQ